MVKTEWTTDPKALVKGAGLPEKTLYRSVGSMPHLGDDATAGGRRHRLCRKGHSQQLHHPQRCTLCRQFSFLPGTTKEWNELQPEANAASTLDTFVSVAC